MQDKYCADCFDDPRRPLQPRLARFMARLKGCLLLVCLLTLLGATARDLGLVARAVVDLGLWAEEWATR